MRARQMRTAMLLAIAACSSDSAGPAANAGARDGGAAAAPTSGNPGSTPAIGAATQGIATYYSADGSGNCSFDPTPNDLMVAAMNAEQYDGSNVCGMCVDVTGPKGKARVRIVDQCPECKTGHLDLSREAFAKIAEVSAGRVPISWTPVRCDVTGPVQFRIKEGSSQWWTGIQVRNHALPITKLELLGSPPKTIARESYNYFVEGSGVGPSAYRVRLTASSGAVIEEEMPVVQEGALVTGKAQFP